MPTPTVLLFDIDGTLVTCGGAGRVAMARAFAEMEGREDVFDFAFGGWTDRAIARQAYANAGRDIDDAGIDRFLGAYLTHLDAALVGNPRYSVFGGVEPLLERVAHLEATAVGLGTGNVEAGARTKLRHGGIEHHFAFGGFGSDHEERPRLIRAGAERGAARLGRSVDDCRVVVIGDTPADVGAARAIGATCLGVTTGSYDAQALAGADHIVPGLDDPTVSAVLGLGE